MILITGGAGYIGSHTALIFLNSGFEVVIFDSLENGHIEIVENLRSAIGGAGGAGGAGKIGMVNLNSCTNEGTLNFVCGNLKNPADLNSLFEKYPIDFVLHFAGYIEVEESVRNPEKYYENNVTGTKNLLDSMLAHNVKNLIFSSTAAVYGNPKYLPIDENHPVSPVNPYGNSKLQVENMLKEYDKKYGLKSVILRYFNAAGADSMLRTGEWHTPESHLIPNILKSALNEEKTFKIFGSDYDTHDGTCIRDYINVEDLAPAHLKAYEYLKKNNTSDVFNLGTKHGYSVKEVFETTQKITGKKIPYEICPKRPGDSAKLIADVKKAETILGWQACKTLEDTIKSAYEWEKKLFKNAKRI